MEAPRSLWMLDENGDARRARCWGEAAILDGQLSRGEQQIRRDAIR